MQPISLAPTAADKLLEPFAPHVAVLMPSFGTCIYRKENEKRVLAWYAERNFQVYLGSDADATGYFSRCRAINSAARAAYTEKTIFILADNDLIPSASHLAQALEHCGEYSAVTPHVTTLHTSHLGRLHLLEGRPTMLFRPRESGSRSYVVIRRDIFAEINGMDEKFEGWGPEDKAFLINIHKQLGGVLELDGERIHLWHPHDRSKNIKPQLMKNRERCKQYEMSDKKGASVLAKEYGHWLERDQQRGRPT